jgi:branched-chain amino acid transport system ATP-binding protein
VLTVEGLSVWYGATEVLRNVCFAVPAGDIVALMGGNGAGKSTTLNALSGLLKPRAGSIIFANDAVAGRHPHDIVVPLLLADDVGARQPRAWGDHAQ